MANLRARLSALENADDGELTILNPRWGLDGPEELTLEEHERQSAERLRLAIASGQRIIYIRPSRSFD